MPEVNAPRGFVITPGKLIEYATLLGFLGAFVTGGWNYVGKPWAQEFITDTLEQRLDVLEGSVSKLLSATAAEADQSEGEAAVNREILCRLRAEQTGADPAACSANRRQ